MVTFYFFNYKFYGTIAERRKIMSSLIIRNALTRKRGSDLVDIKIMDGKINEISTKVSDKDIELLYDMITNMAAKVLNMKGHEMTIGGNADLVVLNQKDVKNAIWYHEEPVHVIKNGVIIK